MGVIAVARLPRDRTVSPAGGGTPILVWVVYVLGILAATIFVLSVLLVLGAYLASDEVPVGFDVSVPAVILWGALVALAAGTWVWRRRAR